MSPREDSETENSSTADSSVPHHVGFIMDGNGRWAQQRHSPRTDGHAQGAEALRQMIRDARERGIAEVTCFALSTENFQRRPQEEIGFLMQLLVEHLLQERKEMDRMQVQFKAIGRLADLPEQTRETMEQVARETADNDGIVLRLAVNYGGRAEIVDALQSLAQEVLESQKQDVGDLEQKIIEHFYEPGMPDLDLLIRTGGDLRLSNFLLWHCSYAELYFTPVLWPDFSAQHLDEALGEYARRPRRFGSIPTAVRRREA
ncbi:MAG: polyprenyl diphosphate synthase [Planctomycetota bacterium]